MRVEPDGRKLNPELLKAGTAYLRARGYRSAELYASTAMTRHKAVYPVPGALEIAAREATRIWRGGVLARREANNRPPCLSRKTPV